MEKISRIIPASARTQSADTSKSLPARPGSVALGRPVGKVTTSGINIEDRVSIGTADRAMDMQPANYKKTVEASRAKVVDDLAKKFFAKNTMDEVRGTEMSGSEQVAKRTETNLENAPAKIATPEIAAEA